MTEIFFDLETMGLYTQTCPILEIAAIARDSDSKLILGYFHEYINPRRHIPANITELTGISDADIASALPEETVLLRFIDFLSNYEDLDPTFIAHNISFDMRFVRDRCARYNILEPISGGVKIDTLKIARQLIKQGKVQTDDSKATLTHLANAFDVQFTAHEAINDVKALIQIYDNLRRVENE